MADIPETHWHEWMNRLTDDQLQQELSYWQRSFRHATHSKSKEAAAKRVSDIEEEIESRNQK